MNKIVGFGALRMQPLHNGHFRLIAEMLKDCDTVIIGLGSVQIERVSANPYTPKERTDFLKTVFGDSKKIKIVPLRDIGAVSEKEWVDYCLNKIKGAGLETPTHYYAGSETDLVWFQNAVNLNNEPIELINLKRFETNLMSATDIRKSLSAGTNEWENYVPLSIKNMIKELYPKELTLSYHLDQKGYNQK